MGVSSVWYLAFVMLSLKFVNRTCGTIANRAHPSVVRRNRQLELNSWSTCGGAVYLAIVMVYGI